MKIPEKKKTVATGVRVKGVTDLAVHLSHCCNPLPGDRIIGYITRGRGVSAVSYTHLDVYKRQGVAGGLLLLWITGIHLFDPLLAIGVALLIIKAAFELMVKAFHPLLLSLIHI